MKCKKCGEKAIINMPQHRLGLCKEHFLGWIPEQAARAIQKYGMFTADENILVAVSGGKDSLSLWTILHDLGYRVDGLYLDLGIDQNTGYSSLSRQFAERFAIKNGLHLHVVEIARRTGKTIPQLAQATRRGREKPCSICGLVKRHEINRFARENGYDVLATGHNLDDEAATLFGNVIKWQPDYLLRQGPLLPATPGLVRKVKPLCRIYEREVAAYAWLRGIEYIYQECPYADGALSLYYKEQLNRLENDYPGTKLIFYLNYIKLRKTGFFCDRQESQQEMHACSVCGQPIAAGELCSYCRMLALVNNDG